MEAMIALAATASLFSAVGVAFLVKQNADLRERMVRVELLFGFRSTGGPVGSREP